MRKIIGVNNALEVINDEDPSDVKLDILSCLSFGDEVMDLFLSLAVDS